MLRSKLASRTSIVFVTMIAIILSLSLVVGSFSSPEPGPVPPPEASMSPTETNRPEVYQPKVELQAGKPPSEPIPAQVVIKFSPNTTEEERAAYIESVGGSVVENIDVLDTVVVTVPEEIAQGPMPESPVVEQSEPDYFVSALEDLAPINDPRYAEQWALPAIGAPTAWGQMPADATKVTIAVIDSGICAFHPDLNGRILAGWDFLESDPVPQDDFGHGCSVSGVIAANMNDGIGIAGVAPNAQIMPLRVLNASGVGSYSDVAVALVYAADHGAQVVNLSLGGSNPSSTLEEAVNYAISKGVIVVAAAGNNGTEGVLYPAAYPDVIAVGSVDPNLQHSSFSNYGSQIDIWAPGRDILTTKRDGGYGLLSGTSFAAPYVAGAEAVNNSLDRSLIQGGVTFRFGEQLPVSTPAITQVETTTPTSETFTPTPRSLPVDPELKDLIETKLKNNNFLADSNSQLMVLDTNIEYPYAVIGYYVADPSKLPESFSPNVALAYNDGNGWSVRIREIDKTDFNDLLDSVPSTILPYDSKVIYAYYPDNKAESQATYTGHFLPWPNGVSHSVTQTPGGCGSHCSGGLAAFAWDFGMANGAEIWASKAGTVTKVQESNNTGTFSWNTTWQRWCTPTNTPPNYVVIDHDDGASLYLHLKKDSVPSEIYVGAKPQRAALVGGAGNVGYVCSSSNTSTSGTHLHYQVQQKSTSTYYTQSGSVDFSDWDEQGSNPTSGNVRTNPTPPPPPPPPPQEQCSSYSYNGITLFSDIECRGTPKQFNTTGFRNLPDFNDQTRSINVSSGWSVRVWAHNDRGTPTACITGDKWDLTKDPYENGQKIYGDGVNISSIEVFNNSTCYSAPQGPGTPNLVYPAPDQNLPNSQSITFDWSDSGDNYTFELKNGPSAQTRIGLTSSSYSTGTLWPGNYQWQVTAYRNGMSAASGWRNLNIRPNAPSSISVTTNSISALTINWGDSAGIDGYKVYRNNSLIRTEGAGTHNYQDTGLACGTTYSYKVTAYKGSLESDPANANGTTSACPVGPDTPVLINPSPSGTSITNPQSVTFDWSDSGSSYTFELTGGPSATTQTGLTSSQTSFGSLWAGVYQWRVTAFRNGNSAVSGWWTLNVLPSAPASISVTTNSISAVTVNWGSSSGGVDGYRVYRNGNLVTTLGSTYSSYQITGLSCDDTSTYSVRGYKGSLDSAPASTTGSTSACPVGPSIPTLLSPGDGESIPNPQSVVFDWSASGDSYIIEITGGPSAGSPSVNTDLLNFGSMWPGVYQWHVKAYRNGQWSAWSSTRILNVPPGAPGSVTVTTNSTSSVTVNWTSSPGGVDGYKVYRNGDQVATVNGSTFSYPVTGLACGDNSTYSVVGYKGTLNSESGSASGTTAECPKTVQVINAFITDENGTATSLEAGPSLMQGDTQAAAIKTAFNAGDNIQLHMEVENQYSTDQTAYFEWIVFDPALREVPELEWRGDLSTPPGTIDWYLPTTIPMEVLTGDYTFIAAITFNSELTYAYYDFHVTGIESVEVTSVYTTDEMGAAGVATGIESEKAAPIQAEPNAEVVNNSIKTTFNAGDPIRLYIDYYNNVSEGEIAYYEWTVIDPWQRVVWDLYYSGDLDNYLGGGWWRLNRNIPSNAITGTYTFTGSITHGERTTSMSTTFFVNGVAGPSNDNIVTPITITNTPYFTSQDTWAATVAPTDPTPTCGSGKNSNSVWYRYTPPASGLLEVDTWGSDYDTVLAVWKGSISNLTLVQCNDDYDDFLEAWLREVPVDAGTTYYIEVMSYGDPGGGYMELYVDFAPSIANDRFETPVSLTNKFNVTADTQGATQAQDDPQLTACNRLPGKASVWYKFVPIWDGELQIDTRGSDYDTMLAIWTGSRGNLSAIGCNDDIGDVNGEWDQDSILAVPVTKGTTYFVEVSTYAGVIDAGGASAAELTKPLPVEQESFASTTQRTRKDAITSTDKITGLQDTDVSVQFWGGQLQLNGIFVPNPPAAGVNIDVADVAGSYVVLPPETSSPPQSYPGTLNGPVRVVSNNGEDIVTSQRVYYGNSFNELMGYPTDQFTTEYWFPWYDQIYMQTWILVGNPNTTQTAYVDIYVGGTKRADMNGSIQTYAIPPGDRVTPQFPGILDGPVKVVSVTGPGTTTPIPIFASERSLYGDSFNEVMGYPSEKFTTEYWFPWYDQIYMQSWVLVGNPSTTQTAYVDIYIGGAKRADLSGNAQTYAIPPGDRVTPQFLGVLDGPVKVVSVTGPGTTTPVPIFTSERSLYETSFNEVMGYPADEFTTEYNYTWYDNLGMKTWVLVGNPSTTRTAYVDIYIGGQKLADLESGTAHTYVLKPGERITPQFNTNSGPVKVISVTGPGTTTPVPVFTSERSLYRTSFNEMMGYPADQLTSEYWFTWYDSIYMNTDVYVSKP